MSKATILRAGSVRVRIFASRTGKYVRHEIRWTDHHGKARRLKRSHRPAALKEARRIAEDLARGHHHAELSLADLASFRLARRHLFGTGATIELACAHFAESHKLLRARLPLPLPAPVELARFYLAHKPSTAVDLTTDQAVARFLEHKKGLGQHANWITALRSYLKKFRTSFPGPIADVRAPAVAAWHVNLPVASARTRNNHLQAVQDLFNLPALAGHPERQAIQALAPILLPEQSVRLWSPQEFAHLLTTAALQPAHAALVPFLVLGGFGKLRTGEILRVDWSDVRLSDRTVALAAGKTKTRRNRLVPLSENCCAWLDRCQRPAGLIWPQSASLLHYRLRALCRQADLVWRENALRKSACTYADLLALDSAAVSRAAGNSPSMLEAHYLAFQGVRRADAEAWFAIQPPAGYTAATVRLEQKAG